MTKRLFLALPLALALALPASAASPTKKVTVNDDYFGSTSLTVKKGTKVKWVWNGTEAPHDVTVQSGPESFRSKLQTSGKFSHVMKKTGTYKLLCTTHAPDMAMTLTVVK